MEDEKEKEKDQGNDIIRELSEKAKENLRRNEELRRRSSPVVILQSGEKLAGLFDPEKVEPEEKEFDGKYRGSNILSRILTQVKKDTGL